MSLFPLSQSSEEQKPQSGFTEEELQLLDKVAKKVIQWKMAVPAILTLESVKPLNFISAQAMVFFEPIVTAIFNLKEYDLFRQMLERRESIEKLLQRIEHFDSISYRKEKLFKKLKRDFLKQQSFGYRLKSSVIGFRVPNYLEAEWKAKLDAIDADAEAAAMNPSGPKS